MAKARPRTGEKREVNRQLNIDRLPPAVHQAILKLYKQGMTWQEIEDLSAQKPSAGGFVDWETLPTAVLVLFPDMRLPHSNLHRWYDLRVAQVTRDTLAQSVRARELAAAFAKGSVPGSEDAVLNAARDQIMAILAEDASTGAKSKTAKALIGLAEVMQQARANSIKERKVAVDERRIMQLERDAELKRKRLEQETENAAKKLTKGELTVEDLNRLRERTFGLPPIAKK